MKQSPRSLWKCLTKDIEACGMTISNLYPCLFVGDKALCISYVDDILFWKKDEADIIELGIKVYAQGLLLDQDYDAAGFLGVC